MVVIGNACRALPNNGSQEVVSSFQLTNAFHQDLLSFEARDASKIGRILAGMTAWSGSARAREDANAQKCSRHVALSPLLASRVLNQHDKRHSRGAQILEKWGTWPSRGQGKTMRPTTPWTKKLNFHGLVCSGGP